MLRVRHHLRSRHPRRGVITLLVAVALLAILAATALVLDQLWLHSARIELSRTAEAAALGAARQLVSDDSLRPANQRGDRLAQARTAALDAATQNLVAGSPLFPSDLNMRFGRLVSTDDAGIQFVETTNHPRTVVVTAHRTRRRDNPVGLLIGGLAGQTAGDVVMRAEATVVNHVIGVRPFAHTPVPAFPLAILKNTTGQRIGWGEQIESRLGADRYGFDPATGLVTSQSDGIPEIELHSRTDSDNADQVNVHLVDLGTNLDPQQLTRQILHGWTVQDLQPLGGVVRFDSTNITLNGTDDFGSAERDAFDQMIGQCRIGLLYASADSDSKTRNVNLTCVQLVAVRLMNVRDQADGSCVLTVQPGVVTTRTALLGAANAATSNRYLYKLQLTQ